MDNGSQQGHFRRVGQEAITNESAEAGNMLPLVQDGVVFRHMLEYPVTDFAAEVGFFASIFGLPSIALTHDYALFTHPEYGYCFSFRKDAHQPLPGSIGLKMLFMTDDIDSADEHLNRTGLVPDKEIRMGSTVQRVIHFATPSGLAIEIWEDPSTDNHIS